MQPSEFKWMPQGIPILAQRQPIRVVSLKMRVRPLASLSGSGIQCCPELWCRSQTQLRSCDAVLAAAAPIQPLAWELSYAITGSLKRKKKKKKKRICNLEINLVGGVSSLAAFQLRAQNCPCRGSGSNPGLGTCTHPGCGQKKGK